MKTKEELESYRIEIPKKVLSVLKEANGVDMETVQVQDDYGFYSTGLFRYNGNDILITLDGGRWHLSVNTDHAIGYYELKEIRYAFCPDGLQMAQIFPSREDFVNVAENCYHLYEIGEEEMEPSVGKLSDKMPSYEELTEQAVVPVTGADLKFGHFETARTVCMSMLNAMRADGLTKEDLPQLLHDVCKFVVLTEANIDKESAIFVMDRFTKLTADLSVLMIRIVRQHMKENSNKK